MKHFAEIERVLKPGGHYLFWTPSRLRGGSSLGLHLIEYTIGDLVRILKTMKFDYSWIDLRFYAVKISISVAGGWLWPVIAYESLLGKVIGLVPGPLKRFVVPPILMNLKNS